MGKSLDSESPTAIGLLWKARSRRISERKLKNMGVLDETISLFRDGYVGRITKKKEVYYCLTSMGKFA